MIYFNKWFKNKDQWRNVELHEEQIHGVCIETNNFNRKLYDDCLKKAKWIYFKTDTEEINDHVISIANALFNKAGMASYTVLQATMDYKVKEQKELLNKMPAKETIDELRKENRET